VATNACEYFDAAKLLAALYPPKVEPMSPDSELSNKDFGSGSIKREKLYSLYGQIKMLSLSKRKPCSQR